MLKIFSALLSALLCLTPFASGYTVDSQIGKGHIGNISQLAIGQQDTLYALESNGKITCFSADGTMTGTFMTGMDNTTAIAVDAEGKIHVLSTQTKTTKIKLGARMREVQVPVGVELGIFEATGNKLGTRKLDQLKSAQAARIVEGKLMVADLSARALVFIDLESGKETGRVEKGLRLCCGIFDFCEAPDHTIAVANLGAFKVQRYELDGTLAMEFGKRGRALDEFHGCCNPVSAAYLPDGSILTVEKDPTRIKIYREDGTNAKQIEGVEELVQGCSFIPTAVDSNGIIYLAANAKGYIVKCVP